MTAAAAADAAEDGYGRRVALLLGAVLAVKLLLLLWLGAALFPDSSGYIQLADDILGGRRWVNALDWWSGPQPLGILRPYGYPLLIALAKLIAGSRFAFLIAGVQCAASIAALGVVAAALPCLVRTPALRYAVILLIAISGSSLYDTVLLSDSLYASLFIAAVFALVLAMCGRLRLGWAALAALGIAWGVSIWIRDVGVFFTLFPLIGLALAGRLRGKGALVILGGGVTFLLPVLALVGAHMAWNAVRTGHAFLTVAPSVNWLWPSINIQAAGLANPFDGGDLVSRVAASHDIPASLPGIYQLVHILWSDYGLDPLAIGHATFAHFLATLGRHPLAYLATVAYNFQPERLAELLLDPFANLNDFLQLGAVASPRVIPGVRELHEMRNAGLAWHAAALAPLLLAAEAAALAGLAAIVLMTPLAAWRRRRSAPGARHAAAAYLWLAFMGVTGAFALIHLEMRYVLPVIPAALVSLGYCLDGCLPRRRGEA